jgi:hypothetical protein
LRPDDLFSACSFSAVAAWILLIVAPRWPWTQRTVRSGGVSIALALVYLVLVARHFGSSSGGFESLDQVSLLVRNPWLLLAGWVHYLAFDLFIGCGRCRMPRSAGFATSWSRRAWCSRSSSAPSASSPTTAFAGAPDTPHAQRGRINREIGCVS